MNYLAYEDRMLAYQKGAADVSAVCHFHNSN